MSFLTLERHCSGARIGWGFDGCAVGRTVGRRREQRLRRGGHGRALDRLGLDQSRDGLSWIEPERAVLDD